jgi:hypothetical protein
MMLKPNNAQYLYLFPFKCIMVLLFTTPFIVQIRGGQLHELWKPHYGSQLRQEPRIKKIQHLFFI